MKTMLRTVNEQGLQYTCLLFVCPGCIEMFGGSGLHMLPVNSKQKYPQWQWDGDLIRPTISPSIITGNTTKTVCHSFLHKGRFKFLDDCTHSLAGQNVGMPDLPWWIMSEAFIGGYNEETTEENNV